MSQKKNDKCVFLAQKRRPDAKATTDANNVGTNMAASEVGLGAGASTVAAAACPTAEKATATTMKTTIIFIAIAYV
ncbi:hypothetical protein Bca4012_008354 [Brassica carinata]